MQQCRYCWKFHTPSTTRRKCSTTHIRTLKITIHQTKLTCSNIEERGSKGSALSVDLSVVGFVSPIVCSITSCAGAGLGSCWNINLLSLKTLDLELLELQFLKYVQTLFRIANKLFIIVLLYHISSIIMPLYSHY